MNIKIGIPVVVLVLSVMCAGELVILSAQNSPGICNLANASSK